MPVDKKEISMFEQLKGVDVKGEIQQKMGLKYLSWPFAWDKMKNYDENAEVTNKMFKQVNPANFQPIEGTNDVPYNITPQGAFVETTVTIKGHSETQILPVMDYKNKVVIKPDMMQINKALQRSFVKALALHGLGLSLYAGEDLPSEANADEHVTKQTRKTAASTKAPSKPVNTPAVKAAKYQAEIAKLAKEYDELTGSEVGITIKAAYELESVKQGTTNIDELTKVGKYIKSKLDEKKAGK